MKILWILLITAAVYLLQKYIYRRCWNHGLNVRVDFTEQHAFEGEETVLAEELINDKNMPLPAVEVRFSVDKNLTYKKHSRENANVTDKNYRRDLFSLLGRQKNIRRLSLLCGKRGCYRIEEIELEGYDYFFSHHYGQKLRQFTQLYVYPRPADIRQIQLISRNLTGMRQLRNPVFQDPFAFAGIREYDRNDPMKRINWKASARTGELMVNQFDATTDICVKCFFDVEDAGILKAPSLVEKSISLATSLAVKLAGENMDVEIAGNAVYTRYEISEGEKEEIQAVAKEEKLNHTVRSACKNLDELYRKMACIRTEQIYCKVSELLMQEIKEIHPQCQYILISKNMAEENKKAAAKLAAEAGSLLWVIPVESVETAEEFLIPNVRILRLEVGA